LLRAGVVQVSGGASNFIGNGGSVVLYGPNGETHFSGGVINNRFVYNAAEDFMLGNWEVDIGDTQFGDHRGPNEFECSGAVAFSH